MKKSILVSLCLFFILGFVRAQDSGAHMYETIYITPIPGKITELNAALSAHNKKYHGEGDHEAFVQSVITGRRTGDYVWLMGPGNFARLDSRPAEGGHDEDWANNVLVNVSEVANAEYWIRDEKAFYSPEDYSGDKIRIRFHKVKIGKGQKYGEMFNKIVDVYRAKKYPRTVTLYWNQFPTAYGRTAATVNGFANWAMYDEDGTFVADFNSVHGEGSFSKWLEEFRSLLDWTDNEVRQNMPALSGVEN